MSVFEAMHACYGISLVYQLFCETQSTPGGYMIPTFKDVQYLILFIL